MRASSTIRLLAAAGLVLSAAACSAGRGFLRPESRWVGEPSALGLDYEVIELPTGDGTSVHGWFLPSPQSDGRTVVLCHGNSANISFYHPYYRFLHAAGLHVCLFDYRGYGRSRGEPAVSALFTDTEAVLAHVCARPDVDRRKVMLFGMSLGAIVALRTAAGHPELAGVVVENAVSPHRLLQRELGGFGAFWAELLALPGGLEPAANAAEYAGPALFLCGEHDPQLVPHLAAAAAHAGPTASWVLPDTGHAPNGLLQHDGDYERAIVDFLHAAADGRAPRLEASLAAAADGVATVAVTRHDLGAAPLPVELALVDADGRVQFERVWLHGDRGVFPLPNGAVPSHVAAWTGARVAGAAGHGDWAPVPGPLRRAADTLPILCDLAARAAAAPGSLPHARAFVATLDRFEAAHGALPELAAAELVLQLVAVADVLAHGDAAADRDLARRLLARAVAAAPAEPRLHYWPAVRYRLGFEHGAAVARARQRLQELGAAP